MDDLRLFRRLREHDLAPDLVPSLDALARLPLAQRMPCLGALHPALSAPEAAVRAAALRALAGADGPLAFAAILAALDDPDPAARRDAVEALRASAAGHPARWAHAVFHPDPVVRRAAVGAAAPVHAERYPFFLLADPACRDEVLARIEAGDDASLPAQSLPSVLELAKKGVLPGPIARRLISWSDARRWLSRARQRDPDRIAALVDADERLAAPPPPEAPGADAFDDFFELLWDAGEAEDERAGSLWREAAAQASDHATARRMVASLLVVAGARGGWGGASGRRAAGLCAALWPRFLVLAWIPRELRRAAVETLYGVGRSARRATDEALREVVLHEICRRPSGRLDLFVVGGLLHLCHEHPYERLRAWVGLEAVLEAFGEDVDGSIPFLSLHDDSKEGRADLIAQICASHPFQRPLLLALLALASPLDALDFLDGLAPPEASEVAIELVGVARRAPPALTPKRTARLAQVLGPRLARGDVRAFLVAWLGSPAPEDLPFGLAVLGAVSLALPAEPLVDAVASLEAELVRRLAAAVPYCASFPHGKELALAHGLVEHPDREVSAWARSRIPAADAPAPPVTRAGEGRIPRLSRSARASIAGAAEAALGAALAPCLAGPTTGLCEALAERPAPAVPAVVACVALLGAHDPIAAVERELARFGSTSPAFLGALDREAVRNWEREPDLPLFGHALLHRWERHAFAAFDALIGLAGGLAEGLATAARLHLGYLAIEVWDAAASVVAMWRWRDRSRLASFATEALGEVLVGALDGPLGEPAARMLVSVHEAGVGGDVLGAVRSIVSGLLPDLSDATREILAPWIESRGLPARPLPRRRSAAELDEETVARLRASDDLDALEAACRAESTRVVEEAALRLLELGEGGTARLVRVLSSATTPPEIRPLLESVALWPDGPSLAALRAYAADPDAPAELRFRLLAGLIERGEREHLEAALAVACEGLSGPHWFRPEDWARLRKAGATDDALALALATSPQAHAYRRALETLLTDPRPTASTLDAVRAFLEQGTERMGELRRRAARWLWALRDRAGFPILLAEVLEQAAPDMPLLAGVHPDLCRLAVDAVLTAGPRAVAESKILKLLEPPEVDPLAAAEAYERLLAQSWNDGVRAAVVPKIEASRRRPAKLREIAETFAWGVRMGRELTGRLFKVEMIGGKGLGYTRFEESRVFVTPLPILRREQHGRELVEGLILHELGHHMYHRGEIAQKAWKEAQEGGFHGLLNLVADEHLERNLRALDPGFGDRLKRLAAYAFQHSAKEIAVAELVDGLAAMAFEVLTATRLGLARGDACVVVESGPLLLAMERSGLGFMRFMRALRMGLGNRHDDPDVAAALELFRTGFRRRSMPELLAVARRLREIFGWQVELVESMGPHEALGDGDGLGLGEGITGAEIDQEIERIAGVPKKPPQGSGRAGAGGRRAINVGPDESFDTIGSVVKVPFDPAEHARHAAMVARPARQMRRYLERLGLRYEPERFRLRGRRVDPTRARAVVLRGDPRMLIARELRVSADLFVGVLVDCSGSMTAKDNIGKARLFGAMLAEAARGLRGVDLRLYGYTDTVIYDAGDAARCAVHALQAGGGNNDAAALWHAAQAALASGRKAKLLVMISDGLPTECSVGALRGLVSRLGGRMGISCAQVAVQPLAEVCFPHYVVLEEGDQDAAVRRFGAIVARLVQRAVAGR